MPSFVSPSTVMQLGAVGLDGEHQAGARGLAVDEDGAGAADAVLAADVGAGEPEVLAQEVDEELARLAAALARLAVDGEPDRRRGRPLSAPPIRDAPGGARGR